MKIHSATIAALEWSRNVSFERKPAPLAERRVDEFHLVPAPLADKAFGRRRPLFSAVLAHFRVNEPKRHIQPSQASIHDAHNPNPCFRPARSCMKKTIVAASTGRANHPLVGVPIPHQAELAPGTGWVMAP